MSKTFCLYLNLIIQEFFEVLRVFLQVFQYYTKNHLTKFFGQSGTLNLKYRLNFFAKILPMYLQTWELPAFN